MTSSVRLRSARASVWVFALAFAVALCGGANAATQNVPPAAASASAAGAGTSAADLIAKGKYLAQAGNCIACHSAEKDGVPLAGGLYIDTPFGAISTPNITPDRATGIGSWTDDQFYRTMHEGIGRHGEYLYPVMPFPWYTILTRDDVMAIKAFLFSVPPVNKPRLTNKLVFPVSVRTSLLAWREVFFKASDFHPDPAQSDEVNRGNYLVNGLTHCGECHNARPIAGMSRWRKPFQGGALNGWYAPNITSDVRSGIGGWSNDQIATYLKTGVAPGKDIAVGIMAETVHSLSVLNDADLHAIAAYLKTTAPVAEKRPTTPLFTGVDARGSDTYLNYCASCHRADGKGQAGAVPPLAGGTGGVSAGGPENVLRVVLGGLPANSQYGPMPAVGAAMTDLEVADVANYVRQSWGNAAPPTATPAKVAELRRTTDTPMNMAKEGSCPGVTGDVARALNNPANGIAAQLNQLDLSRLWQGSEGLVEKVKRAAPKANNVDIVNGLTAAFCPRVRADDQLAWNAKPLLLGQFSQLVYMATRPGNRAGASLTAQH